MTENPADHVADGFGPQLPAPAHAGFDLRVRDGVSQVKRCHRHGLSPQIGFGGGQAAGC
tara:strand:- start:5808 stop:5984 length:177 start_codon:yes stop_codon:yes gene_type:complete